ncbi:MAG TPA: biotin--[acetyl-CoA-carboxylase] ligase [Chthonomonadales bacterium]|nr:biotin--[acetyl-CoA-carboxylase] ligase [Chthonomonadales bacterium]
MRLHVRDQVSSTMDVAREEVLSGRIRFNEQGIPDPAGIVARSQLAGRGQRGRVWYSAAGESLAATYFLKCAGGPQTAGQLAFVAALAVIEALESQLQLRLSQSPEPGTSPRIGIKWPNDIMLNGKKAGGLLIEVVGQQGAWTALIGCGVNVHSQKLPQGLAIRSTSLAMEGVTGCSIMEIAEAAAVSLHRWEAVRAEEGFSKILSHWREHDETSGRFFETELNGKVVVGLAEGVDDSGALRIVSADGGEVAVRSASSLVEL